MTETNPAIDSASVPLALLHQWLDKKLAARAWLNVLGSLLGLAGGALVSAFTYFLTYGIVWFTVNFGMSAAAELAFGKRLHLSHKTMVWICVIFLVLLFVENLRTSREYLSSYTVKHAAPGQLVAEAGALGSLDL